MFEQTDTGWRATDEQVAYWEARDTCPACTAVTSPAATIDGVHHYSCPCQPNLPVRWTRNA